MGNAKEALQIYAIGSSIGNEKLVKQASRGCLRCTPKDLFELDDATTIRQPASGVHSTFFGSGAFRPSTEDDTSTSMAYLLRRMSAWEYHRLLSLYRKRTRGAKSIISSVQVGAQGSFTYQNNGYPLTHGVKCGQCLGDVATKWKTRAEVELELSGPTSERIFSREFFSACIEKNCDRCCKAIFHDNAQFFDNLKKKIDALPDSV
jgi:hypothetical protein